MLQVKTVPATAKPQETQLPEDDLRRRPCRTAAPRGIFGIRYPKEWAAQERAPGAAAAYASEEGGALEIVERDMLSQGLGKIEQAEYANQVLDRLSATAPGFKLLAVEPFETAAGLTAEIITYNDLDGARKCAVLLYLHEERQAFTATYCAAPARYRALAAADSRFVPQLLGRDGEIAHFAVKRRGCGKMAQLTVRAKEPHDATT